MRVACELEMLEHKDVVVVQGYFRELIEIKDKYHCCWLHGSIIFSSLELVCKDYCLIPRVGYLPCALAGGA